MMTRQNEKLRSMRDDLRLAMLGTHARDDVEHNQTVAEETARAVQLILDVLIDGAKEE